MLEERRPEMKRNCVLILGCALALSCSPTRRVMDNGGTTETTNAMVIGKIYAMVDSAIVKPAFARIGIYRSTLLPFAINYQYDSCVTDSLGDFAIEVQDTGYFNLLVVGNAKLLGLVSNLHLKAADTVQVFDTMQLSGSIAGIVAKSLSSDTGRVLVYVPGTFFIAPVDSTGHFSLPFLPPQTITLEFALQLPADSMGIVRYATYDTAISVKPVSGDTLWIDTVRLGVPKDSAFINHAPVFTNAPGSMTANAVVGKEYRDTLYASDPDGDSLRFSFIDSITAMQLSGTIISLTPSSQDTGVHSIAVMVWDGRGGKDTLSWILTISDSALPQPDIHMGMKLIPGGTFTMGSVTGSADEQPQHSVTVDSFWMDSTEVTNEKFKTMMGYLWVDPGNAVLPVVGVTWYEAIIYCTEISIKANLDPVYIYPQKVKDANNRWTIAGTLTIDYTKKGFRIPTEAEWEYACRAGSDQPFYWNTLSGNQYLDDTASLYAWYLFNSQGVPHQVGTKKPNVWGLYEMVGNAMEWCNDWYDATYYQTSLSANPAGPQTGTKKVLRGGSWVNSITEMRMPIRYSGYPSNKDPGNVDDLFWEVRGFRTILSQ